MSKAILLDNRVGSKDLFPALKKYGAKMVRLESADIMFTGNGPEGPVGIGIERKRITDLVGSMESGRLVDHQIPLLLEHYERPYILIEGLWRTNPKTGHFEYRRSATDAWRPLRFRERTFYGKSIHGFINTLQSLVGIPVVQCHSKTETVHWILALYDWWNKEWGKHKSHRTLQQSCKGTWQPSQFSTRPNIVRRVAACLPGIGDERSLAVSQRFQTPLEMFEATVEDWQEIAGIGKGTAEKVTKALREGR